MKTLARIVVLVVCLGMLGAMMWRALEGGVAGPRAVEADGEQRTIAYVASSRAGPRFVLPPGADEGRSVFRLLSYLHLPLRTGPAAYSPESRFAYGLRWVVREASGEQVAQGTVWAQTRKSKADFSGGSWRKESVYYSAGQGTGEPADGRLTDLDLTSYAGRGRTVEFLAVGAKDGAGSFDTEQDGAEINLVVFKQFDREEFRQEWLERTLSRRRRQELAGYARVRSWSEFSLGERQAILDRGWERQSSLVEVPTRTLYQTGFRLHESVLVEEPGELVSKRKHLVYNLQGPARLKVALRAEQGVDAGGIDVDVPLQATVLSTSLGAQADLVHRTHTSRVPVLLKSQGVRRLDELARHAQTVVEVPAGRAASVRLRADIDRPLRAVAFIDRRQAVMGEGDVLEIGAPDALLRPDWKAFSQWELRPGQGARFTLAENGHTVGQALRLSLRGVAYRPDERAPGRLDYRFLKAGEVLTSGTITPSPLTSSFERLEPRVVRSARPGAPAPEMPTHLVSEPMSHRFWLPKGATHLELDASGGPVLVGVAALVFSEDARDATKRPPYDKAPLGLSWRYAPSRFEPWQTFHPTNIDELEAQGQRRQVRAQVRLRPDWDAVEDPERAFSALCGDAAGPCELLEPVEPPEADAEQEVAAVVLAPRGKPVSRLVAEPADLQPTSPHHVALLSEQWDASYRTRFEPGADVPCKIERGARVALDYRFADFSLLGGTLEVLWDGVLLEERLIRTQRDRIYVRPRGVGRTGRLSVRIAPPGKSEVGENEIAGVSLTADCSPASVTQVATVVRLRRVYRLSPSRPLRVRVPTSADEAPTLYIGAYAPGPPASFELSAQVDAGSPTLRLDGPVAQITAAERTLTFERTPLQVELQSSPPRLLSGPSFAAVPTGTDWQAGWHEVEIEAPKGRQVWVRFYTRVVDPGLRQMVD